MELQLILSRQELPTRALTKITSDWSNWVKNTKLRNPMKRTTLPEDIGNVIAMLLQKEADFINCSIVYCDGGESRSGHYNITDLSPVQS